VLTDLRRCIWVAFNCLCSYVDVNETADSQAKQSIEEGKIVNYYQWQTLKPSGKRKAKGSFTVSVKTPKGTEQKATLKRTTGMSRLGGSAR
jgi:hypothetical protein